MHLRPTRPVAANMLLRKRIVICNWYPVTDERFVAPGDADQGLASASPVASMETKSVAQVLASRAG